MVPTRREFLTTALLIPTAFRQTSGERFVANVPLGTSARQRTAPLERLLGSGLNARLFTDLSKGIPVASALRHAQGVPSLLRDGSRTMPIVPTERFFIRTAAPQRLPNPTDWSIEISGAVQAPARLTLASLESLGTRSGRYLIECSGNSDPANYGLMSTADWEGVPLAAVLDRLKPAADGWRVLVSGVDDETDPAGTSVPGASWIFSRDDLSRALLATRMNGAPLARDHGAPVRLVVPGWYGCACIKWVNRIELVRDEAPATAQMKEFAARTHQPFDPSTLRQAQGRPEQRRGTRASGSSRAASRDDSQAGLDSLRARDFAPAVIDTAAMPVRVDKWAGAGGRVFYRIAGIIWGGTKPTNALSIRFRSNLPWTNVEDCPLPSSTDTWSLWTHTWRPQSPGRYTIVLHVDDPSIRTRRLDLFFYARDIQIDDV